MQLSLDCLVITLSLRSEEVVQGVVDMSMSETDSPQVKFEQDDPLAKSSSEYGGSEEEKDNLDNEASDDGSVNLSSLLGHSIDDAGDTLNEEAAGDNLNEEAAGEDMHDANALSGLDKTGDGVEAVKAGGEGSAEVEIIVIDSDDSESEEEIEMGEELTNEDVIRTIKSEPKSDSESGRRARLPKEPDAQEPYGTDEDTIDTDASVHSGGEADPEGVVDDEDDDRSEVSQNHADDVANGHDGGGVDEEHEGGGVADDDIERGGVDDDVAGDGQLNEEYGTGWLKEMAVAHDDLFYRYMVRSCAVFLTFAF